VTFEVGSPIVAREVLHGETWLELHETVVSDDGRLLATVLTDGTPLTRHPEHPFGPHPCSSYEARVAPTVLTPRRAGRWWAPWDSWSP
jgi:hypothetical protein